MFFFYVKFAIFVTPSSVQNCHEIDQSWTLPIGHNMKTVNHCHLELPPTTFSKMWSKSEDIFAILNGIRQLNALQTRKTSFLRHNQFLILLQHLHIVWKLLKMSHLIFLILAFLTNFCPIKTDLSGNTVWQQALGFQKLAKMD